MGRGALTALFENAVFVQPAGDPLVCRGVVEVVIGALPGLSETQPESGRDDQDQGTGAHEAILERAS